MNVNNAFLHDDLNECVFMTPLEVYESVFHGKVCKLNKSLYDLKQTSHQWNEKLRCAMFDFSFVQFLNDYSLFMYIKDMSMCLLWYM